MNLTAEEAFQLGFLAGGTAMLDTMQLVEYTTGFIWDRFDELNGGTAPDGVDTAIETALNDLLEDREVPAE